MLGKGMWEIVRMARTLDGMADRENEPQETNHDEGDNQDSLERDQSQSDRRQNAFVNNPPNTQWDRKPEEKKSQRSDHPSSTDVP